LSHAVSEPYTSRGGGVQPPLFVLVTEPGPHSTAGSTDSLLLNNDEVP
jgi:hypothetical protein